MGSFLMLISFIFLVMSLIGLISPKIVLGKWGAKVNRFQTFMIFIFLFVVCIVGGSQMSLHEYRAEKEKQAEVVNADKKVETVQPKPAITPKPEPAVVKAPEEKTKENKVEGSDSQTALPKPIEKPNSQTVKPVMTPIIIIIVLLISVIAYIAFLLINSKKTVSQLNHKYKNIIDSEKFAADIRTEAETFAKNLKDEATRSSEEAHLQINQLKTEMENLKQKYDIGKQRLQELNTHISTLEENSDMLDFGLYKPHFDFSTSEEYKHAAEKNYDRQKELIKNEVAMIFPIDWTVNGSKSEGRKMVKQNMKVMLRAFNGECDSSIAKVRWDNVLKMEERIKKSFESINKSGEVTKISITNDYLKSKLDELRLAYELAEKIKEERDEQRRIQEEMREEEKARREIEKAKMAAEKEEERYQNALEKARAEIEKLTGAKADAMSQKIADLEKMLAEAQAVKARAISQAQLTKSGYVYIISNIGSFGENVFKIGMTRRLEPLDRVKELGDASVPFPFDVHAMIYSENAPDLENRFHKKFDRSSINLVNMRKEFFNISLDDLEIFTKESNLNLELMKIAEAKEFRESVKIRSEGKTGEAVERFEKTFLSTDNLFEQD